MKIKQDPETGKIQFCLDVGENPDIEERVQALTEFVSQQAVETYRHTHSYRKIVGRLNSIEGRLDSIEVQLNKELEYQAEQRERQE